jgi:hypothetical protein
MLRTGTIEERPVGGEEEHGIREVAGDVHDLRPDQGLAAGDDEERHAELRSLADDASHLARGQLVPGIAANGLGVAAAASEVAAVRDAEDHDGRDGEALACEAGTDPGGLDLPENGLGEEERLARASVAHAGDVPEEVPQAPVDRRSARNSRLAR